MKDARASSWLVDSPIRLLIPQHKSSPICSAPYPTPYVAQSPSITARSSPIITVFINYRCAPFSATLMPRGRRAGLKMPSDACAEDCRGKRIWLPCPINACSACFVLIVTLRESALTTKLLRRSLPVTCCTSNVNPPSGLRRNDERRISAFQNQLEWELLKPVSQ